MASALAPNFSFEDQLNVRIADRESTPNTFDSIDGRELLDIHAIADNPETSSVALAGTGYDAWFTALIEIR